MRCGAVLGSGARCGREAEPDHELCAYHHSIGLRREARASHFARLSAEDQEALGPAGQLEGVDAEIAVLRVLIRRAARAGNVDAFRRGIDSLCLALVTRRQLAAGATHGLGATLEAVLEMAGLESGGEHGPRPELDGWGPVLDVGQESLPDQEIEAAALVLRYQGGEPEALELLYGLLEVAILAVLLHYRDSESPSALTLPDLQDESRIVLTQLVERWRPEVSFLGYFFGGFPSAIARHVRQAHPVRSRAVAASDAADEALPRPVPSVAGSPQGPFSAGDLASLPELERQVVLLRVFAAQDMRAIARQVGVSVATAYRRYRRARGRLEGLTRSPGGRGSAAMRRLVQALHVTAGPDGRLPSRAWAMAAAGLKRLEYDELMAHLAGAHAIYGRGQRVPGHLVERDAAATLARLGDGEPASA